MEQFSRALSLARNVWVRNNTLQVLTTILIGPILDLPMLQVADIHMYEDSARSSQQARLKVEKMEKELNALINSSMAYKSVYKKTAKQMAMEAMEACESEAASSKKIRKTVVESSSKRAAVA